MTEPFDRGENFPYVFKAARNGQHAPPTGRLAAAPLAGHGGQANARRLARNANFLPGRRKNQHQEAELPGPGSRPAWE